MNFSKYINNISSLQFFQLFRFGILFLISICFAKSYLSIGEIGIYEKLIFLSGAVSFFWVNSLIQSLLSLYNNNKTFKNNCKNSLLFNAFLLTVVITFIIAIILLVLEKNISNFLISADSIPYKWVFIIFFVISTPSSLLEYFYLLLNKPKQIIKYSILTFSLQFFAVIVPIWLGYGIKESIIGLSIISGIRLIWLFVIIINNSYFEISFQFIKEHITLASPLILSTFISGSITYIDGIIVSNNFNNDTFAIYRYGARELPLVMLLANSFSNAMVPRFSNNNNISEFLITIKEKSRNLMHLLFPISILLILFSQFIFTKIFNPKFIDAASVFNVFILLIINRLIFPQTILLALKKTKILLLSSVIEFTAKVIFSILLLKYFGIVGIAYGTLISFTVERIIMIYYNYKYLNIKPLTYIDFKWLSFYSILIILFYLFVERNNFHLNFLL